MSRAGTTALGVERRVSGGVIEHRLQLVEYLLPVGLELRPDDVALEWAAVVQQFARNAASAPVDPRSSGAT